MKKPVSYLLPLLLAACQSHPAETTPVAQPGTAPAVAPGPRFNSGISGYWISAAYLETLARTRSPKAAIEQVLAEAPVILNVPTAPPLADSLTVPVVYGLHEGAELTVFPRPGQAANSLAIREQGGDPQAIRSELAYQVSPTDTLLLLLRHSYSAHGQKTTRFAYRRVPRQAAKSALSPDPTSSFDYALNKLLVAGLYTGTDSVGHPLQVEFRPDGRVTGLPFRTYLVRADFVGPSAGDALTFDSETGTRQELAADYSANELRLYTIRSAAVVVNGVAVDSAGDYIRGRLRYQLVRRR